MRSTIRRERVPWRSVLPRAGRRLLHGVQEGWYIHGDPESQDRLSLVKFNLSSNVVANLIGGNFFYGAFAAAERERFLRWSCQHAHFFR